MIGLTGYIKKYSTTHLVTGANRGLIYDSNRKKIFLVPLSLITFIQNIEHKEIAEVNDTYKDTQPEMLMEYLDFLIDNEVIFFCQSTEEITRFPEMDTTWVYPGQITNAVADVSNVDTIKTFNNSKGNLFIPYIQFNLALQIKSLNGLEMLIESMLTDNLKAVQIIFENSANIQEDELIQLCKKYGRIETIIAYGSQIEKTVSSFSYRIDLITEPKITNKNCGIVNQKYFNLQLPHYTESLAHNTCLNRKIAIDVDGNIKNCSSMKESFGNIKDTTLEEAINKPGFKKYWNITKDEITKCKDCEFRYICTDCRAYIENPEDIYSAPLKCGYNPYTCEWEEWSTNPLKQQAIEYYGMSEMIKKDNKN